MAERGLRSVILIGGGEPTLYPRFAEWMMMLPDGWVTDPDLPLSRTARLRLLGNGVVPSQAAAAFHSLLKGT